MIIVWEFYAVCRGLSWSRALWIALCLCGLSSALQGQPKFETTTGYIGSSKCGKCHDSIAREQLESNMRGTWKSAQSHPFSTEYLNRKREGPSPTIDYTVKGGGGGLVYRVQMEGFPTREFPIDSIIGGPRFGVGFLVKLREVGGLELSRAAHIETRYRHDSRHGGLGLTAGHPRAKPTSPETAFGRVMAPGFEKRCLTCHGDPRLMPNGEAGISCEVCHGPGKPHLTALRTGREGLGIINPGNRPPAEIVDFCGQCHGSDLARLRDPRPQDLLISNQAYAIRLTECYVQSGEAFSCLDCHDPHRNAQRDDPRYVATCKSCHGGQMGAGLCPVDAEKGCIDCHMPRRREGTMADHWIRVVSPSENLPGSGFKRGESRVPPKRLFLRLITVNSRSQAHELRDRLGRGGSFHELAQKYSRDVNGVRGGFLGAIRPADMNSTLAKAADDLRPGEMSPIVSLGGQFAILKRVPRDFRARAIELEEKASDLKRRGMVKAAVRTYQESLTVYPHFLRALKQLGVTLRELKDFRNGIAVLSRAAFLYPEDSGIAYELGLAHGMAGHRAREAALQQRAVALDPESIAPRMRLGVLRFQQGRLAEAAASFEEALRLNPLLAAAYSNLGHTREKQGRRKEAQKFLKLAQTIRGH